MEKAKQIQEPLLESGAGTIGKLDNADNETKA